MKINTKATLLGFCYMTLGLSPVYADDTDIFLGNVPAGTVKPNVLFILDNSGSMTYPTSEDNPTSRLATLQNSMADILTNAQGINAGIMHFNTPGGYVRYPVTDLDAPLTTNLQLSPRISQSGDDAAQSLATGGGDSSVTLDEGVLYLGIKPDLTSVVNATFPLVENNDDEEQSISGNMRFGGARIDMTGTQINGFRFQNIDIPNDATIIDSSLTFQASEKTDNDVTLRFYAENTPSASIFSNINSNISSRTKTNAYTDWQPIKWKKNRSYTSPDISAPIREVINSPSWTSGNHLAIIQTHESSGGARYAKSRNNSSSDSAKLNISYQLAGQPVADQRIGLRFQNVEVPRGATITNAYITLVPATSNTPDGGLDLDIKLENAADAAAFSATSGDLTSTSTVSTVVPWTAGDWVQNESVQTPDLAAQLQQVTSSSAWCGGNDVAFYIEPTNSGETLSRAAYSFDGDASKQPRLIVEYDPTSIPTSTCGTIVIKRQISGQPDDAEQQEVNIVVNDGKSFDMHSGQTNGLRFENLPIAQNATILEAKITFTAREDASGSQTLTFKTQNSVTAPNFPEVNNNITDRSTGSGSVAWGSSSSPALTSWSKDLKYTTPDLKSIIQPLVNNASWNPASNGVVFIQTASSGSSNKRAAYTFDDSPGGAAFLEVKVNLDDVPGGVSSLYTVRTHLKSVVQNMQATGSTPIVDTLYEAARYYRGDDVYWGTARNFPNPTIDKFYPEGNLNQNRKRVSDSASYKGGTRELPAGCSDDNLSADECKGEYISGSPKYISPITESCQQNYIVLLTDGKAYNNNSRDLIKNYVGHSGACKNRDGAEGCSEELINWLANNDMSTASVGNNADGENYVNTYTIALSLGEGSPDPFEDSGKARLYLENLANEGGGSYYEAGSEAALTTAFKDIIGSILTTDSTFVVPGTTVSQFNRMSHFEDIYFSVFKPSKNPRWDGNLKKYKLSRTQGPKYGKVVGVGDKLALDPKTGFFKDGISSFWNVAGSDPDGQSVVLGGASNRLPEDPDKRNVYTYYSGASTTLSNNELDESNTAITKEMLGAPTLSDQARENLLNWARGEDFFDIDDDGSKDDIRHQFGDALHSAPVAITYGGTDTKPDFSVFFATNDGFLHSINGDTGIEEFAFIPELLLPNLKTLFDNSVADKHPYGIDSTIMRWVYDANKDNQINASDGDHVYIYFGLRRGGSNYYALDVTDRKNPKLMWQIDGGTSPFEEIGQSWSIPDIASIKVEESGKVVKKNVLVFSAGYDPDQDTALVRTKDDKGRAIFMVEADYPSSGTTPELVWSAGKGTNFDVNMTEMDYSIPGQIKVGDTTGDGLVNVIYAADVGGQILRFDFNNGQTIDKIATGAVIADLSKDSSAVDSRRFYGGIDIAPLAYKGQRFMTLTLGSGWRANPLDESVQDRFYMIKQPISKPSAYLKLTETDLYDATANLIGSTDPSVAAQAQTDLDSKAGWYIDLGSSGEKVLSPSITAQGKTFFTTYVPNVSADPCNPTPGKSFVYGVNLINATPFYEDSSGNGNLVRQLSATGSNIPPSPSAIVNPDGTVSILAGGETISLEANPVHKTYWYDE